MRGEVDGCRRGEHKRRKKRERRVERLAREKRRSDNGAKERWALGECGYVKALDGQ